MNEDGEKVFLLQLELSDHVSAVSLDREEVKAMQGRQAIKR